MEYKPITIYCPRCGRKTGTHDGRGTLPKTTKCSKCNVRVIYNPKTMQTKVKRFEQGFSSAGKMFL